MLSDVSPRNFRIVDIETVEIALDRPSVPRAPSLLKSDIRPSYAVSHERQNLNFPSMKAQEVAVGAEEIEPSGFTAIVEGIQSLRSLRNFPSLR